MEKMIEKLNHVDQIIKKRHRYHCGLETTAVPSGLRMRVFFLSPDGQNGELYYELRNNGLSHSKYTAEYHWKLRDPNSNWVLSFSEGDIDIYQEPK